MLTQAQRDQVNAILDGAADLTVATVRPDGWPQATVVSFVHDSVNLYFGTWAKSQKAQNIARDDRVSVTVTCPYKTWDQIKGVSIGARAKRVTAAEEMSKVGALMAAKFPQLGDFVQSTSPEDMALFRVEPVAISILDYTQGFGHTETAAP